MRRKESVHEEQDTQRKTREISEESALYTYKQIFNATNMPIDGVNAERIKKTNVKERKRKIVQNEKFDEEEGSYGVERFCRRIDACLCA